jgi:uncharacterized membrane protein YkgB
VSRPHVGDGMGPSSFTGTGSAMGERMSADAGGRGVDLVRTSVLVQRAGMSIARWGVVLTLAWIGATKFTPAEARGIKALIEHSPLLAWMYVVWSEQGASNVIGVLEILAAALLAARPWAPRPAVVGAAMAVATFVVTLSFMLTTPGAIDMTHGMPLPGGAAQFLVKDVVLLGASLWALGDALRATAASAR